MQNFKGDTTELKFIEVGRELFDSLEGQRDDFFNDAYGTFILGELLHDSKRVPLSNAIPRDVFRESFESIFEAFLEAGSFEGYIKVFQDIFGDSVDLTFTIPASGRLQIDIVADAVVLFDLVSREIVADAFVNNEIVDQESDNIGVQQIKGFKTQYEVELMLNEMVPSGVFTEITLTLS